MIASWKYGLVVVAESWRNFDFEYDYDGEENEAANRRTSSCAGRVAFTSCGGGGSSGLDIQWIVTNKTKARVGFVDLLMGLRE